ncbi:MAG: anaerobic ribonucleoside-triphosphate reductase activating protein [Bacteroidales bacterium]|jgi:anaerobic ribonucleoside-triphosphate reductase activating protein|nr:anaerobic ribonucleoside-triphosphate reductase activating protein [Bacteroidales bacterium]
MLKYVNTSVVFLEIPDETTLSINISNCPNRCPGCHSEYLWEDIGAELDEAAIDELVATVRRDITCVCFMGGDSDLVRLQQLADYVHERYPEYKVGWYSGRIRLPKHFDRQKFDYIKVGPYLAHLGPLNSPTTNQRMYRRCADGSFEDITSKFWKKHLQ